MGFDHFCELCGIFIETDNFISRRYCEKCCIERREEVDNLIAENQYKDEMELCKEEADLYEKYCDSDCGDDPYDRTNLIDDLPNHSWP